MIMKLSLKDYWMIILIVIIYITWFLIIENTKYNNEKSLINQKYCLELWIWEDKELSDITKCNKY
jgi:hypothetical protein